MKTLIKLFLAGLLSISVANAFEATLEATEINGVKVQLLPEDGEANEDGVIDQFWLNDIIVNNKPLPKGIHIVDLRKSERYKVSHIKGSINVPFDNKTEKMDLSKLPKDGVVVFYCNTGLMSTNARGTLEDELAERVLVFDATYKCDDKKHDNCKLTPNEAL